MLDFQSSVPKAGLGNHKWKSFGRKKAQLQVTGQVSNLVFLQASWDAEISIYSEAELRDIFSKHGAVEEVIPRPAKKQNKGSALVVMKDLEVGST